MDEHWTTGSPQLDETAKLGPGQVWAVVGSSRSGVTNLVNMIASAAPRPTLVVNGHHAARPAGLAPLVAFDPGMRLPGLDEARWVDSTMDRACLVVLDTLDEVWPDSLWSAPAHTLVQYVRHLRSLARDTDTTLLITDRRPVRSGPVPLGEHRTDNALLDVADVHVQVHSYLAGSWSLTVVGRGLCGWAGRARAAALEH
ncbi:MAG TPA: hypothetical protein VGK17_22545 [Propionicimonas sp.]|jgi:hypothetical protein